MDHVRVHPSIALATTLVDELVRVGVTDAVLAPGSRSAPFAYALQAADTAGRIRLHVRVDERSAAFLALGLAKATRVPVPVVVTSGTAVANLHPAVLEAHQAAVPMLILSADRPPELRGTGANQTTDQLHLFGQSVRWFHDLGAPRDGESAGWRSVASRAVAASRGLPGGDPGPVHLNVPLRDPLVPDGGVLDGSDGEGGRPDGRPWLEVGAESAPATGQSVSAVPKTLAILGDVPDPTQAALFTELADSAGWPLIAEPFGRFHRARVLPHGPLILQAEDFVAAQLPERVLIGGRPTLDRGVARLLRRPDVSVEVVVPGSTWADPSHTARRIYGWSALDRSHDTVAGTADRDWAGRWRSAGMALAAAAGPYVESTWPSGLAVARTVAHSLPPAAGLFVGSSSIARYLDLARESAHVARDVVAVANRGLAGIDGSVSTAIGFALSRPGRPTYAVLGDLTFAHDANGLLIGPDEPRPDLTIVVINDDGGGIFGTLEPGQTGASSAYERVFGTPTGLSIGGLCSAYGVPHEVVTRADELAQRITAPRNGIRVIEVRVDRRRQRAWQDGLYAVARDAVRDVQP